LVAVTGRVPTSALGHKRTCRPEIAMSALPLKADIAEPDQNVCFGPIADITKWRSRLRSATNRSCRIHIAEAIVLLRWGKRGVESWRRKRRRRTRNRRPEARESLKQRYQGNFESNYALAAERSSAAFALPERFGAVVIRRASLTRRGHERRRPRACAMSQPMISALCSIDPRRPERPS
jgi:hypothetical protein